MTQDDPRTTQDDARVTQDDGGVTQDDPRVTQDDLRQSPHRQYFSPDFWFLFWVKFLIKNKKIKKSGFFLGDFPQSAH